MKQIIIGIHGLGNKTSAEQLKKWWMQSINEGLNNIGKSRTIIPFELVYWADIIHPKPLDVTITDKYNPLFEDEPYVKGESNERKNGSKVQSKILKYIEEELDKIFLNEDLTINFKGITDIIMRKYFVDLDIYYNENSLSPNNKDGFTKQKIQNRLLSILQKYKDYKILLIAHSMGSIIAFDVLSNHSENININTFISIGSALGLPVIVSRIFAEQKTKSQKINKPITPNCISKSWFNMSDKYDKVAIDHTLADDFAPNIFGIGVLDISVYNNYEINGKANPHKTYGYLRTPEIATIIDSFLEQERIDTFYQKYKAFANIILSIFNKIKIFFQR